jgi:hypothetical protein
MANLLKQAQQEAANHKPVRVPVTYLPTMDSAQVIPALPANQSDALTRHAWWVAEQTQQARQAIEDARANYRNRNRFLTLGAALVISFVLTFVFTHGYLGPTGKFLAPYSFVITILLDSSLTLYAYVRKY